MPLFNFIRTKRGRKRKSFRKYDSETTSW